MKFEDSLQKATLIKRYKRFLADICLEEGAEKDQEVVAYVANPGAMLTLQKPGSTIWISKVPPESDRKLRYDWHLIETAPGTLVGVNTSLANKIVHEALLEKRIPEFQSYDKIRPEVKYGQNSRIDFLLEDSTASKASPCYLEVKNVNHIDLDGHTALFPDAVTKRGTKHLEELIELVKQGKRACVLYLMQRGDCDGFKAAADIDPVFAKTMQRAHQSGVEFYCYACKVTPEEIILEKRIKILDLD